VVADKLQDKNRVLDIGPGFGIWLAVLDELGHDAYAVDVVDDYKIQFPEIYDKRDIHFSLCNAEVDDLPFDDNFFDAVTCSQALEHFTHSHLHVVKEIYRVLKPGGIIEIDVPNVVCWRNRWRLLRGKILPGITKIATCTKSPYRMKICLSFQIDIIENLPEKKWKYCYPRADLVKLKHSSSPKRNFVMVLIESIQFFPTCGMGSQHFAITSLALL
jgi:ubiquinone/menaquinone biosynthesis C-methylase UbiE